MLFAITRLFCFILLHACLPKLSLCPSCPRPLPSGIVDDLRIDFGAMPLRTGAGAGSGGVVFATLEERVERHRGVGVKDYKDDAVYEGLVLELLETRRTCERTARALTILFLSQFAGA